MNNLGKDIALGLRLFRRAPTFVAVVVTTLALGVGANAAILSVVRSVLFEPLPYAQPEDLVRVWPMLDSVDSPAGFSIPDFRDWRDRAQTLESIALYSNAPGNLVVRAGDGAIEVDTLYTTAGFFDTLGIEPVLGRFPNPEEARTNPFVVVLSERLWRNSYDADTSLLGETISLSDRPYELIGVAPSGHPLPGPQIDAWVLFDVIRPEEIPLERRPVRILDAVARTAPGLSLEVIESDLSRVAREVAAAYPDTNSDILSARVARLHESIVGDVELGLLVVLAAVAAILLIACANVANLFLVRSAGRRNEFAVRAALGSTRRRLARMVVIESTLLGLVAGGLGLLLARGLTPWLAGRAGSWIPRADQSHLDAGVGLLTLLLSLVLGCAFGGFGVLRMQHAGPTLSTARGTALQRHGRSSLVVAEVALATVLLVAAGLMVRSLDRLTTVDPGFEAERLASMTVSFAPSRYGERGAYLTAYRTLLQKLEEIPGVEGVATIKQLPLRGAGERQSWSLPSDAEGTERYAFYQPVSPNVFEVMGTPLLAGRGLPQEPARAVLVVNESLARQAFGNDLQAAVGRTLLVGGGIEAEILGVVGDVRSQTLSEASPATVYVPQMLMPRRVAAFVVRGERDPAQLLGPMRSALAALDPAQAVTEIAVVDQIVRSTLSRPRFLTQLLGAFAGLAALLSGIGIYGVVSYRMAQRLPELGLRKAIGASTPALARLVVASVLGPVGLGVALGGVGAAAMTRGLSGLLFETAPLDPATYLAVFAGVGFVALLACWRPILQARRLDATEVLRAN
ncbi:MAG: ADOP family duplicated permease [Acidobacteriota bacterium]